MRYMLVDNNIENIKLQTKKNNDEFNKCRDNNI